MKDIDKTMEKRKYARVPVDAYITATLTTDKAFQEKPFISKDISPEGMFLVTNKAFPMGVILNLKIHTPTTSEPIDVEAKVIRIAKDQNLRVIGMGLIFIRINEVDKRELSKHLYLAYHYLKH